MINTKPCDVLPGWDANEECPAPRRRTGYILPPPVIDDVVATSRLVRVHP